ncbi:heavy metal-associated isoprenylated plant protein 19-like, partial [Cornus florida]|uniref:heavy metal-associated isoprenylated plant protein 19-like n=1 Tax=Cornus florida TaxID=4283 RepID=UPI0028A27C34
NYISCHYLQAVVVEFRVSMHCNACERTVAKAISKIKGVEKFTTEMKKHKVVVTGRINPQKFVKKLKKKTGKRVEIVGDKNESKGEGKEKDLSLATDPLLIDCWGDSEVLYTMFSDENANACSIM